MKTSPVQNGIQTGITFGVIVVTMFLIGFTVIGAQLIGKVLGNSNSTGMPAMSYFVIFMILIGAWCGNRAAKRPAYGTDSLCGFSRFVSRFNLRTFYGDHRADFWHILRQSH